MHRAKVLARNLQPFNKGRRTMPAQYEHIKDVPTDMLAYNFVSTLIHAKGDISKWDALAKMLIRQLRGEPDPTDQ